MNIQGLDRFFYSLSSTLSEPFCRTSDLVLYRLAAPVQLGEFDQRTKLIEEIAVRSLILLSTTAALLLFAYKPWTFAVVLGVGAFSKVCKAAAFLFQKGDCIHLLGKTEEKKIINSQIKVMTFNICGLSGGLSKPCGGMVDLQYRVEKIIRLIQKEDPDVLFLQEVFDERDAKALIHGLQNSYAHIFTHLGFSLWGLESGSLIFCKQGISKFSRTPFLENDWINRGFFTFEIKKDPLDSEGVIQFIGTHLTSGSSKERQKQRKSELQYLLDQTKNKEIPTFLVGDLNIERDAENKEDTKTLSQHFAHTYLEKQPTCTNQFVTKWDRTYKDALDETIDYVSELKREEPPLKAAARLVKAFDPSSSKLSISDHHALVSTLTLNS